MNELGRLQRILNETDDGLRNILLRHAAANDNYYEECMNYAKTVKQEIEKYKTTGILNVVYPSGSANTSISNGNENVEPKTSTTKAKRGRPKKTTLLNSISLSSTEEQNPMNLKKQPYVKLERMSVQNNQQNNQTVQVNQVTKVENEEMPPPKGKPLRNRKATTMKTEPRSTRSKQKKAVVVEEATSEETATRPTRSTRKRVKKESVDEEDFDVIIEEKPIEVINLDDTLSNEGAKMQNVIEKIAKKRSRSVSNGEDKENAKRSKSTEYEDAVSELDPIVDVHRSINGTFVVSKNRNKKSPTETDMSPVKKKIEAFEKLAMSEQSKATGKGRNVAKSVSTTKSGTGTPLAGQALSQKSQSALKASQQEYHLRRQREAEAASKREAWMKEQIEEKKRKREKKELKVQQLKEQQKRDRLKSLETQKIKEEKHNKLIREQEEKRQKLKEEAEQKRQLAKQRAMEEKLKEQKILLKPIKKADQEELGKLVVSSKGNETIVVNDSRAKPLFLLHRAPLLPTDDCYDSDDENADNKVINKPAWSLVHNMTRVQVYMTSIGEKYKNTFFCAQPLSADLVDIFKIVHPNQLKRTSSAHWKKPPRYTLMPVIKS